MSCMHIDFLRKLNDYIVMTLCMESCIYTHLGKTVRVGRGFTHIYPYNEEDPSGPGRTHMNTRQHMERASLCSSPVSQS